MKGVIISCLRDMVVDYYGLSKWEEVLERGGLDRQHVFLLTNSIDFRLAVQIIASACKVLNSSFEQIMEAFGEYWVKVYAPKLYGFYLRNVNSAKDLILRIDEIHQKAARDLTNTKPPRFQYEWKDDKTLIIKCFSSWRLVDLAVGIFRGVGKRYQENLRVEKIDNHRIEIVFPF